jgi:hypothetical protein
MTEKLETVLEKIPTIPNPINSSLMQEFYQFISVVFVAPPRPPLLAASKIWCIIAQTASVSHIYFLLLQIRV